MNTHVRNEIDNRYLSRTQHRQHGKWNCQQMEWCSRWQWHMCTESFLDKSKQCNTELEFLPLWLIVWRINKCYGNYKHCWRIDHRIKICHRTTRARSDLFRWPIETTFDYLSSACGARPNPSQFIAQLLSHCCIMLTLVSTTFHCSGSNLIFVVPFLWSHTFCSFHIDSLIATKLAPQRPTVQPRRGYEKLINRLKNTCSLRFTQFTIFSSVNHFWPQPNRRKQKAINLISFFLLVWRHNKTHSEQHRTHWAFPFTAYARPTPTTRNKIEEKKKKTTKTKRNF